MTKPTTLRVKPTTLRVKPALGFTSEQYDIWETRYRIPRGFYAGETVTKYREVPAGTPLANTEGEDPFWRVPTRTKIVAAGLSRRQVGQFLEKRWPDEDSIDPSSTRVVGMKGVTD